MYRMVIVGMASISCALGSASHAEMDAGCVQRLLGQKNQRLQLCSERFQGEHRGLCETAANRVHERDVKICASRTRDVREGHRPAG
jgi:hypothetical protein